MNQSPNEPPPPHVAAAKSGGCCCGAGCLTLFIVALLGVALIIGGAWYIYGKTIDSLTAAAPVAVQLETPSEAQFAAANAKLTQMRDAQARQQSVTVEFTAADLNALIARHPDFSDLRRKARVAIANSILSLDVSIPLDSVPLPRMNGRWLNGSVNLGLAYDEDRFDLNIRSLTANGREITSGFFDAMADWLNDTTNRSFDESQQQNPRFNELFEDVKSMAVVGDKLVVTTKGAAAQPTATPALEQ